MRAWMEHLPCLACSFTKRQPADQTASTAQSSKVSLQGLWVVGPLAPGRHAPCEDGAPTAGVCVCDRTPGCPRGINSAAHFCNRHCKKWSKEAIFLKKWLNKAFQDTVGRIMSPRGWQKLVTILNNALCSWGHPSGQPTAPQNLKENR